MDAKDLVLRFIDAINRRDVEAVAGLLAEDHVFIDSLGAEVHGREAMREGWRAYFSMVPDYAITVSEVLVWGETVVVLGSASGTYSSGGPPRAEDRWSTPAAWRAVVAGDRLALWQVFADNEPIRAIMRRRKRGSTP